MKFDFKKGFTLMEVNMAIFVMSVGVLSMVSLYSLGYREQSQSNEDVVSAAVAESYLAPLVASLSDPNLPWSKFKQIKSTPSGGWGVNGYLQNVSSENSDLLKVIQNPTAKANEAFGVANKGSLGISAPPSFGKLNVALVVTRKNDYSPIVGLALRAGRRAGALMGQPLYYTEVHFQGDPTK